MDKEPRIHGMEECPLYGDVVLIGEDDNCTLCGFRPSARLADIFKAVKEQCFQDGHDSAVHHVELYGLGNLAARIEARQTGAQS